MNKKSDDIQGVNTNQTDNAISKIGDSITVAYVGALADGTVFDSNIDPKFKHVQPFTFTLGAGQVIPGWDKGLVGMKVGERKHLVISPEDAYGANGYPPVIPPNSTLTFDVQITAIN
ncbi:MAG: FKBP-type peptidyl-prolyl cis-trans isomerase [Candidatus Nomurabacteria bacterium]|nr:FKBP-type peptidyl-prolyl cis-trans isomerase [Candidatus Nomurabacteria bacterium]